MAEIQPQLSLDMNNIRLDFGTISSGRSLDAAAWTSLGFLISPWTLFRATW